MFKYRVGFKNVSDKGGVMKSTHLDAEQRYSQVRMNTIKAAQVKINKTSEYKDIELKCIDGKALKLARWWSNSTKRKVD